MQSYGIGELRRYLNVEFTRVALPVKVTADGETVAVLLSVAQYRKLVADYKDGSARPG
jgi:hypothetical protein